MQTLNGKKDQKNLGVIWKTDLKKFGDKMLD